MYVKEIIIILLILIIALGYLFRRKLSDYRNPINELRDNNKRTKDINRQSGVIIEHISDEIGEVAGLNNDIGEDNQSVSDIIKAVRKQKLD